MKYDFSKFKNKKFGRLEVRARDQENKRPGAYWWFYCECGNYKSIRVTNVMRGKTTSCGCKRREYFLRLRGELRDIDKLQKALDVALRAMAKPGVYRFHDNDVKEINEILYGKTGE